MANPRLFSPLVLRDVNINNRIWISPMCQYSSIDGYPNDWHLAHLGSRAVGGAGLVMVEATAVTPIGRISPLDNGLWSDAHIPAYHRLTELIKSQGSRAGIQIAHAGRKGSTTPPWEGDRQVSVAEGGWQPVAPSPIPFKKENPPPLALSREAIDQCVSDFVQAAARSLAAGFEVLELHMAHGYLLHEFLSPLANQRQDEYGGSLENRMRFPLAVAAAVRAVWPANLPLFVRISATDWAYGPEEVNPDFCPPKDQPAAWHLAEAILFAQRLKALGVDLIDCSSGGLIPDAKMMIGPGYQVPFAAAIRQEAQIATAAVGLITDPAQAESILLQGQADAIFIARESLRSPYWPQQAARALRTEIERPRQYLRA